MAKNGGTGSPRYLQPHLQKYCSMAYPGKKFKHARGVRQGDPLSPLLFILAIDPLQKIIELVAQRNLIHQVLPKAAKLRCSLYADDAALFANPDPKELSHIGQLLQVFARCSGLKVNMNKTEIFSIRCTEDMISNSDRFPRESFLIPRQISGLTTTHSQTPEGRCAAAP